MELWRWNDGDQSGAPDSGDAVPQLHQSRSLHCSCHGLQHLWTQLHLHTSLHRRSVRNTVLLSGAQSVQSLETCLCCISQACGWNSGRTGVWPPFLSVDLLLTARVPFLFLTFRFFLTWCFLDFSCILEIKILMVCLCFMLCPAPRDLSVVINGDQRAAGNDITFTLMVGEVS